MTRIDVTSSSSKHYVKNKVVRVFECRQYICYSQVTSGWQGTCQSQCGGTRSPTSPSTHTQFRSVVSPFSIQSMCKCIQNPIVDDRVQYLICNLVLMSTIFQGLFKNDFPGLRFQNFLLDGVPIGGDLSGTYVLEKIYGISESRSKWGDLAIVVAMVVIYRMLFFVFIKLSENLAPRLRVMMREYFTGTAGSRVELQENADKTAWPQLKFLQQVYAHNQFKQDKLGIALGTIMYYNSRA